MAEPGAAAPDTPIAAPTFPAPSRLDQVKGLIGDLARPFVLYMVGGSVFVVPLVLALRIDGKEIELIAGATFVAAIGATAGALYWGKAWEVAKGTKHASEAEIAKTNSGATP